MEYRILRAKTRALKRAIIILVIKIIERAKYNLKIASTWLSVY